MLQVAGAAVMVVVMVVVVVVVVVVSPSCFCDAAQNRLITLTRTVSGTTYTHAVLKQQTAYVIESHMEGAGVWAAKLVRVRTHHRAKAPTSMPHQTARPHLPARPSSQSDTDTFRIANHPPSPTPSTISL